MSKRPDGTPGKKPPALSTSQRVGLPPVMLVTALPAINHVGDDRRAGRNVSLPGSVVSNMADPSDIKAVIVRQVLIAVERRGAYPLLSIIESYGGTLSNAEFLRLLRDYNAGRPVLMLGGLDEPHRRRGW